MYKLTSFETNLLTAFKAFILEKNNLKLDFRVHVYLENQYGATPCYSYSDAETVVDCMSDFFDKYHVDYSGRYNRSMTIESLRTQKLNDFLLVHLEQEIEEVIFIAVNTDDTTTKITDVSILDDEYGSTAIVEAQNAIGKKETFYVQTTDAEYRSDLGCWLIAGGDDIDQDDYPFFDFHLIISSAERCVRDTYEIKETADSELYLKVYNNKVEVVELNRNFINKDSSSYQTEYKLVETFVDEDDADKYIAELNKN
ncbi:MAG: hypothetical protein ACJA0H_001070 [Francisellaceae bacterium]|jgi:hypothetical protein